MKLKDCPFCGSAVTKEDVLETDSGIGCLSGEYVVCCPICSAGTSTYSSKKEAGNVWNKRVNKKG